MKLLYVLYDKDCSLCQACKRWLERQPKYINLAFIAQQSNQLKILMPELVEDVKLEEPILVTDEGQVYKGAKAWIMCMYALKEYREWALVFARPGFRELARTVVHQISVHRKSISEAMVHLGHKPDCGGSCAS